ncbi:Ppx/GppA phosphatase family protein [Micrococcoides hystricis]|uniref:Exopolyphosphatase n=1 Tax=Micrococcoides hystricis TaxID=1572761 RepID=A0ABV6P931_9MICC
MNAQRYAALDCGTNSLRLLIAEYDAATGTLTELARDMHIVRLGEGVDKTGQFSPAALARTFQTTEDYAARIRELGVPVENIRFVATSASRDVANRDEFITGITDRLGVEPEIISGDEEAALSFAGAAGALGFHHGTRVLVLDLGGGSTEFVTGIITETGPEVQAAISTDMGCVRFTERLMPSDPPTPSEQAAAEKAVMEKIQEAAAVVDFGSIDAVVGVAGTITTITAEALNLVDYNSEAIHGAECTIDDLHQASTTLIDSTRTLRAERGFMHPGRVDVIGAGALIYRTILTYVRERSGVQTALASEQDILDGILLSLLPKNT